MVGATAGDRVVVDAAATKEVVDAAAVDDCFELIRTRIVVDSTNVGIPLELIQVVIGGATTACAIRSAVGAMVGTVLVGGGGKREATLPAVGIPVGAGFNVAATVVAESEVASSTEIGGSGQERANADAAFVGSAMVHPEQ